MRALLARLQKRIAALKCHIARQSMEPNALRQAWAHFQDSGELPADELPRAYCLLMEAFGEFADTSCSVVGDEAGLERHRQACERYEQAEREFRRLEREHGIR